MSTVHKHSRSETDEQDTLNAVSEHDIAVNEHDNPVSGHSQSAANEAIVDEVATANEISQPGEASQSSETAQSGEAAAPMQRRRAKPSLLDGWNAAPNLVTYSRIALVLLFLGMYISAGPWGLNNLPMRWSAAVIFILAASTDKIDGWLARKYDQVTELGKLMDPIADKLLTCGALVVASVFGEFPWWATALFLVREIGITVMRFVVMERPHGKVIAAAWPGKLKTVFQCVGLSMLLLPVWQFCATAVALMDAPTWLNVYLLITYVLLYLALFLCLYSGVLYLYNTFGLSPRTSARRSSAASSRRSSKASSASSPRRAAKKPSKSSTQRKHSR